MNNLKTTDNGGFPFVLDDLRWEADAVREAFFGLVTAWGVTASDSYILSGCDNVINGLNYDVGAGYIVLEGEVFKVDAHSVVITAPIGETHTWEIVETNDPAGTKTFDAGGTFETYKIRRAQITTSLTPGLVAVPKADTIHKKIFDSIDEFEGVWQTIDLTGNLDVMQNDGTSGQGNDIALDATPTSGYLKYLKKGNRITINVIAKGLRTTTYSSSNAASFVIKNLPFVFKTGLTPSQEAISRGKSTSGSAISGILETFAESGTNRLAFSLPARGTYGSFNRLYVWTSDVSITYNPTADQSIKTTWDISANMSFEID